MNDELYTQEGLACTVYGKAMTLKDALESLKRKGAKEIVRVLHLDDKIEICWR